MVERPSDFAFDLRKWKQKWQDREFDDKFAELHIQYLYAQHMAYRGASTIQDATQEEDRLLAGVAWEACELHLDRLLDGEFSSIPGSKPYRPEALIGWGLKVSRGRAKKPTVLKDDSRGIFFYQAVRILQIITETEHQRRWSSLVSKVYNRLKPTNADSVKPETVRSAYRKFRQWESG